MEIFNRTGRIQPITEAVRLIAFLVFLTTMIGTGCTSRNALLVESTSSPVISTNSAMPPDTTPTIQTQPPPDPASSSTPTLVPLDRPQYIIDAILNYPAHQLQVDETIRYTNRSTDSLVDLVLMVDPLYYPGAFKLDSLSWANGKSIGDYKTETGWLRIPLPEPLRPGGVIQLKLTYYLILPSPVPNSSIRPIPFGYTGRQTNLVDWYPFVAPYQPGKGWLAHPAGYYGEHLVYENSDFEINIFIEDGSPDLVIAASSLPVRDGDWYRYKHENARNFVWSASPYYQVLTAQSGQVQISSYAFGGEEIPNQAVLQTTVESLQLYEKLFGPYPRTHLTVVEADFLDGMEYDGLYFLSKGFYNLYQQTPAGYLVAIAAHETAHQWWYAQVANDQAMEPWLDEALCTYSERLYYETIHPEALDWWWDYRVKYYEPRGWIDVTIYNPTGEVNAYRSYRDAVYLNGAMFLEELRKEIGDAAFFAFLKAYRSQMMNKIATANDFFVILEQYTPVDLSSLIKKYFHNR